MSILATSPDLTKIIRTAVNRIGENHALARDNKGLEIKATEMKETEIIEEALKAVADEMAEKMVLENTIDGMVKDVIQEQETETETVTVGGVEYNVSKTIQDIIGNFKVELEDLVGLTAENLESVRKGLIKSIGWKGLSRNGGTEEGEINTIFEPLVKAAKEKETIDGFYDDDKEDIEYLKSIGLWDEDTTIDESTISTIKKLVRKKLKETKKDPGIREYEKAHKTSGSENKQNLKDTKKKFEEYANFNGNDKPEFPHTANSNTAAGYGKYENTTEDQEFIDDFAFPGLQDFDVHNQDMKRITDYLEGSSETGNAQTDSEGNALANVVPSDLGKKMKKSVERRKEKIANQKASMTNLKGITPDVQKVVQVKEGVETDVDGMKRLWIYNKNTQ